VSKVKHYISSEKKSNEMSLVVASECDFSFIYNVWSIFWKG